MHGIGQDKEFVAFYPAYLSNPGHPCSVFLGGAYPRDRLHFVFFPFAEAEQK